jgi:hypothetical protein
MEKMIKWKIIKIRIIGISNQIQFAQVIFFLIFFENFIKNFYTNFNLI